MLRKRNNIKELIDKERSQNSMVSMSGEEDIGCRTAGIMFSGNCVFLPFTLSLHAPHFLFPHVPRVLPSEGFSEQSCKRLGLWSLSGIDAEKFEI